VYAKAAQENANLGQKVKLLQIQVGKLQREGYVMSPAEEVVQVENGIRAAWNVVNTLEPHLRKQIELGRPGYEPELSRLMRQKAWIEKIQDDHKAGVKSNKELLQALEDFGNIK
jgi:predicted ATPase